MGKRFFTALAAIALAVSLAVAPAAWADESTRENAGESAGGVTVEGTDHYGAVGSADTIDVLMVTAPKGATLYVTVAYSQTPILKDFKREIDPTAEPVLVALSARGIDMGSLDKYTVTVRQGTPRGETLYTGKLHGVYGDMGGTRVLIGIRTLASDGSEGDRIFQPAATFFYQEKSYRLAKGQQPDGDGVYRYEEYSASDTITGRIVYLDQDGKQIRETPIEGIEAGKPTEVKLPSLIELQTDEGTVCYRVVNPGGNPTITVTYPGQTEFVVHCKQMNFPTSGAGSVGTPYIAKIEYYDMEGVEEGGEGELVMTDTLTVAKDFIYTVPLSFSQMRPVGEGGAQVMLTYQLCDEQPSSALSGNGAIDINFEQPYGTESKADADPNTKYFRVNYWSSNPEKEAAVTYTVRYINAAPNSPRWGAVLKTQDVLVTRDQGTLAFTPEASIEADGTTLVPYGKTFNLKYSTSTSPVYDIYYVSDGYTPVDSYDVIVNYVNIANNEVLQTGKVTIDPTVAGEMLIGPAPETVQVNGVNYLRLDGQAEPFTHNYFSPARIYTVYYRDSRDTQYGNTVVRRTVVRYIDDGATGGEGAGAAGAASGEGAGAGAPGAADGETPTAQASLAGQGGQLSAVDNGSGDGLLLNSEGVDTATERELEDDATPLAQGLANTQTDEAAPTAGLSAGAMAGVGLGVLAVAAAAIWLFLSLRRRKSHKKAEVQA